MNLHLQRAEERVRVFVLSNFTSRVVLKRNRLVYRDVYRGRPRKIPYEGFRHYLMKCHPAPRKRT